MNQYEDFIRGDAYQCTMNAANSLNMISASLTERISPLNSAIQSMQELNRHACNLVESFPALSKINQYITSNSNPIPIEIAQSMPSLSDLANSTRSVLNLPHIAEQFRNPEFEEFCSSYERLMQSLDFPAVQPEITKDQLEKRLEQMDNNEILKTTSSTINAVSHAPISKNTKKKLIKLVKSGLLIVVIPYLINVASDLTSDLIKNKMAQAKNEQQVSQDTHENINVTINNYNIELSDINREADEFTHECNCDCNNRANNNAAKEGLPPIATSAFKLD